MRGRHRWTRWSWSAGRDAGPGVKRVSTNELTNRVSGGSWRSRPIKRRLEGKGGGREGSRRTSYHPLLRLRHVYCSCSRGLVTNDSGTHRESERGRNGRPRVRDGRGRDDECSSLFPLRWRTHRPLPRSSNVRRNEARSNTFFFDRVNALTALTLRAQLTTVVSVVVREFR